MIAKVEPAKLSALFALLHLTRVEDVGWRVEGVFSRGFLITKMSEGLSPFLFRKISVDFAV